MFKTMQYLNFTALAVLTKKQTNPDLQNLTHSCTYFNIIADVLVWPFGCPPPKKRHLQKGLLLKT